MGAEGESTYYQRPNIFSLPPLKDEYIRKMISNKTNYCIVCPSFPIGSNSSSFFAVVLFYEDGVGVTMTYPTVSSPWNKARHFHAK